MARKRKAERDPIVFGLTFERWSNTPFWNSYRKVWRNSGDAEFQVTNARTDCARNQIAQWFMEHPKYSHLLYLDSDQVYPPDIVQRLLSHKKLVVSNLYFHRSYPYAPHMYTWNHTELTKDGKPTMDAIKYWTPNSLVECDAVGTGGMLIARRTLEIIPYPWFEYGGFEESEDVTFCRKLSAAGIKVYCDTACESGHITEVIIGHENWFWARDRMEKGEK